MRFIYLTPPKAGFVFNLDVTGVVGTAHIEWFVNRDLIHSHDCVAPSCDDRRFMQSEWAGNKLRIIGTDQVATEEIIVRILGTVPTTNDFVERKPDMVPEKFPKIRDMLHRTGTVRFKTSSGSKVRLQHTGSKYYPAPINVEINGTRKGTIGTDGSFSARPDIPLDDFVEAVLREFNRNPRSALEDYGRETGVCGVCGRTLTNPASIRRGIGPVCAGIAS